MTDTSLAPIAGAGVTLLGSSISVTAGDNGRFRIADLPPGRYVVSVRRIGYEVATLFVTLAPGDTLRPSIALRRAVLELDTMRTVAGTTGSGINEFDERRTLGVGHFITADEIYRRNPINIADVLRTVLSVAIFEKGFNRTAVSMRGGCPFQIFVDGLLFSAHGDLSDVPAPRAIAGVEIYSGPATIPLQYKRADTMCGVILIWTKRS